MHDAVELDEPVEGLVAGAPLTVGPLIVLSDAVLAGQVAVEFGAQSVQTLAQIELGIGKVGGVHAVVGLHGAEAAEGAIGEFGALLDVGKGELLDPVALDGALDVVEGGETDEGVAGAHVEVDVGERLDLVVSLELGDELEEEAQLADFYGLFHDVDAVEVADDDRFEDEVRLAGMVAYMGPDLAEIAQGLGAVGALRTFQVVEKAFHGLKAGGVERFEYVEGGEEEGAGAAGGVENGNGG